ncbi:RING-H2 finger protein ATL57 [Bienertia sinuspersici]
MALTVLVLLTALFFMGFFSIYIRRFADESSVDPTRRRRSSETPASSTRTTYRSMSAKGVDPTTVKSLPVHAYYGGGAKQGIEEMECAICLSEFEDREWIKEIPYCGHVFHVECIDTWLESHVTCPLCRTAKLLVEGHVEETERERHATASEMMGEVRLVVDGGDTWNNQVVEEREVGPMRGGRRSTSCLWCGDRVRLHRSLSF